MRQGEGVRNAMEQKEKGQQGKEESCGCSSSLTLFPSYSSDEPIRLD
jgi:hypothetical protein